MIPSGYKKLVAWLSPLVFQGYPPAQHVMGTWHANGKYSLPQNHELACRLFSFSSKQGYPEGMYDYAKCLELGIGCPKNTRQALNWYNAAAIHGHSMAAEKIRNVSAIAEPVDILPFTNSQSKLSVQWLILNL
jgi:TPR repeat protein